MELTSEEAFLTAVHEAMRTPKLRVLVVLQLSILAPPAPRQYHRRIAHAILNEAAQRHGGRVFLLRNGDAALLCRQPGGASLGRSPVQPSLLPSLFARLFQVDLDGAEPLTRIWLLEEGGEALLAYAGSLCVPAP